jgi:hypothetical protein
MHVCIHSVDESSRVVEGSYSPDENAFFHIARRDSRESKIQIELATVWYDSQQFGKLDSTLHVCTVAVVEYIGTERTVHVCTW